MQAEFEDRAQYFPDAAFDIVVVASSAGGIVALTNIFAALPANFPIAIAVVQHLHPDYTSHLAQILAKKSSMTVKQAEDGDIIRASTIYVAPPDNHLLIRRNNRFLLSQAPAVKFLRPSANLLFISAATIFRQRVIGVVLSGMGSDGAVGVQVINHKQGKVIVQNKATAQHYDMPNAAIQTGVVDFILPLNDIADHLVALVKLEGTV